MTDLDLKPPKTIDREAARTLHIRGIMILEQAFEAKLIRSLRRVLKSVSGGFGALVSAAEPGEPVASFDDLAAINAGWATEVEEELIPLLLDTFASGAQNTSLSVAGVVEIPEFVHTQSVGWMADASNRLSRVSDEAWQAVRSELTVGLTEGESIDQLQRRIRGTIDVVEVRARTIARTEVIGAVNAGSYYEAKGLGVQTKTWLATEDSRTRPTHNRADDQTVGIDEMFEVGGALMRFPHDPAAPAKETVNCRCTNLYDHNDLCMCVPGWAQSETGEQLVAATSSNCACSGDAATEAQTAAAAPTLDAEAEQFADEDEEHTGAMVALVPTNPDALVLDGEGAEPVEELHTTLFYLGDAVDIPTELQTAILAEIGNRAATNWAGPIEAQAFGAAIWNPNGDDPSLVLSIGGPDLAPIKDDMGQAIINAPDNVEGERPDWQMVEQHRPWAAHLCLAYDDPEALVEQMPTALSRVGPIEYDRIRVAFADEVHDFRLGGDG